MLAQLVTYYLRYFQEHGEAALTTICNCKVPSDILLVEYKKLPPIEEMGEKEKTEMKKYVIELFPDKSVQDKLRCCKVIYTIGSLI